MATIKPFIKAYVTFAEKQEIQSKAAMCGMTVSRFIQRCCLRLEKIDPTRLDTMKTLAEIKADQARLGNLLHQSVQAKIFRNQENDIQELLEEIAYNQNQLKQKIIEI